MKKTTMTILAVIMLLCLCACGDGDKDAEVTTGKTDWRNTIEYEGAFYVNEELRVLYAFDTGSITLWDNAGNGEKLQTIEYDTSVADAIERIEKEDINGDGNRDIRIIYSESEEGTRYNLFLWSDKTGKFAECRIYNEITDPVVDEETGYVVGVWDRGLFGTVTKKYVFNENSGLDLVESVVSDPEGTAINIAQNIIGSSTSVTPATGKATIEDNSCDAFIVYDGSKSVAYIAYTTDGEWYADKGCLGFYRAVTEEEGKIVPGAYVGECGAAQKLADAIKGEDVEIISVISGFVAGETAHKYGMKTESGENIFFANDDKGFWYFSENGETFVQVNASTGAVVGEEEVSFDLPIEE